MTWEYHQSTGHLYHNGTLITRGGYSGHGRGKNNPDLENLAGTATAGPIPRGDYTIGHPHTSARTGRHVMNLSPVGHNACGRTDFQIHGESNRHPGQASSGCIIISPKSLRERISGSGDNLLRVIR